MTINRAIAWAFDSHTEAEAATKALQSRHFDMKKLSIVGKGYPTEEHLVGFFNAEPNSRRHELADMPAPSGPVPSGSSKGTN